MVRSSTGGPKGYPWVKETKSHSHKIPYILLLVHKIVLAHISLCWSIQGQDKLTELAHNIIVTMYSGSKAQLYDTYGEAKGGAHARGNGNR